MNLTGQILFSLPNIKDERFKKSVIYICAHTSDGAMGIVINKTLEMELYPNLLKELGIEKNKINKKIFFNYGGPVETSRGFILHSDDVIKKESIPINKGVILSNTIEIFEDLSNGKGPEFSMVALGYAGWGAQQLENEILNNGWMFTNVNSKFIFDDNPNTKWEKAYEILGVDPYSMSDKAGRA
tara:strand:+ start:1248 stop:1799 length:552 start_codon:yes stop_codon:yes gene_type:complete